MKSKKPGSGKGGMPDSGYLMGTIGGWGVHLAAKLQLDSNDYRLFNDVELPAGNGGKKIDHVIVSQYGVFMIETVNMKGQIFGEINQQAWVQQTSERKQTFHNPLPHNDRHARILAAMLGLAANKVFPVLVFVGGASFKTPMPANVTRAGGYVRYIKSKTIPVLTKSEVAQMVQKIESGNFKTMPIVHARQAQDKAPANKADKRCPRCGSPMKLRVAKKGDQAGKRFWVCATYPTCKAAIAASPATPTTASIPGFRVDFGPPKVM